MLYKFIHIDGYEAVIKDLDAFIGYVNTSAINEKTRVFDELKNEGKTAYEVNEFREIFDTMKKNGWSVYSIPKAIEKTTNIENYKLKAEKNNEEKETFLIDYNDPNEDKKEQLVKKEVSSLRKMSATHIRLSSNARMFFSVAATALIFLSFIIIMVSVKLVSENNLQPELVLKKIAISLAIAFLITIIFSKVIFSQKFFVTFLMFSILMFSISVFQFVDSLEKQREKDKKNSIEYRVYKDNKYF
jgi:hypothetical protein